MSLTTPKRLFHVPSMSTVMYENVADDVKEKGYVAISHVWGEQTIYNPKELGIKGGVSWKVPFSDPKKMDRVITAMKTFVHKYCWLDVVCMPQDKQDEINLEIPFMGDYYAGAAMTIVLSDEVYPEPEHLSRWYYMMEEIMNKPRNFTSDEHEYVKYVKSLKDNTFVPADAWFTRVWTLQEAILSPELFLIDKEGSVRDLTSFLRKLYLFNQRTSARIVFGDFVEHLIHLQSGVDISYLKQTSLGNMSSVRGARNSYKEQDKFYGMLGILGYKDFVVDYDIEPKELNKKIVQYACSKGDFSWMGLLGSATGFIQPMYEESKCIGENWKEDKPGSSGLRFEDDSMYLNVCAFAKITHVIDTTTSNNTLIGRCVYTLKFLGFNMNDIVDIMTSYIYLEDDAIEVIKIKLDRQDGSLNEELALEVGNPIIRDGNWDRHHQTAEDILLDITRMETNVNICKAISFGEEIPLLIYGNVDPGDDVMLVRMHDNRGRSLAIVSSKGQRKAIMTYKFLDIADDDVNAYYLPYKYML